MSKKFLSFQTKVIAFLMGLLGFSACDNDPVVEYETPVGTYNVNGITVDKNNQAIKNIRAVITNVPAERGWQTSRDTVYTNDSGEFNLSKEAFPMQEVKIAIELTDIDGDENGKYQTRNDTVIFKREELSGGSGWNEGTATRELGKITLSQKEGTTE